MKKYRSMWGMFKALLSSNSLPSPPSSVFPTGTEDCGTGPVTWRSRPANQPAQEPLHQHPAMWVKLPFCNNQNLPQSRISSNIRCYSLAQEIWWQRNHLIVLIVELKPVQISDPPWIQYLPLKSVELSRGCRTWWTLSLLVYIENIPHVTKWPCYPCNLDHSGD